MQYFQYCIYACVEGINILCIFVRYGVVERLKIRTSGEISAEAYLLSCKNNLILWLDELGEKQRENWNRKKFQNSIVYNSNNFIYQFYVNILCKYSDKILNLNKLFE